MALLLLLKNLGFKFLRFNEENQPFFIVWSTHPIVCACVVGGCVYRLHCRLHITNSSLSHLSKKKKLRAKLPFIQSHLPVKETKAEIDARKMDRWRHPLTGSTFEHQTVDCVMCIHGMIVVFKLMDTQLLKNAIFRVTWYFDWKFAFIRIVFENTPM